VVAVLASAADKTGAVGPDIGAGADIGIIGEAIDAVGATGFENPASGAV
jgi:hypothetical protein